MKQSDFKKEPWKHPAVQASHLVKMTWEGADGAYISLATCRCGWSNRVALGRGAGHVEQDDAIDAHWQSVIATAGAPA